MTCLRRTKPNYVGFFKREIVQETRRIDHLLDHAFKRRIVLRMSHKLVGLALQDTAPGQATICAFRLTPLAKSDAGVRPVVVSEMLRAQRQVILRSTAKADILLSTPFGIGLSGRVEAVFLSLHTSNRSGP